MVTLRRNLLRVGKSAEDDDHVFYLFVRPKDAKVEQWEGSRSGTQAAIDVFNADEVHQETYYKHRHG